MTPYKVTDMNICKHDICIPLHFVIVKKNISHHVILGTSFLDKIMPINIIDEKGITTSYKSKNIAFEFVTNPIV